MTHYPVLLLRLLMVIWLAASMALPGICSAQTAASSKPAKTKATKNKLSATKNTAQDENASPNGTIEKPLDLSIPYNNSNFPAELPSATTENLLTNIFAPNNQKKPRSVELEGDFLMSPEPEAEKRKSVDGAGFIIRLKP